MGKLTAIIFLLFFSTNLFSQWEEKAESVSTSFLAVDIHESGICYAVGYPFMKSEDFGETWSEAEFHGIDSIYFDFVVFNDVKVLSASVVVAVGWHGPNYNNVIIRTEDGGENWDLVYDGPYGTGIQFNAVDFYDELTGVVVGDNGLTYKTDDGGVTWSASPSGITDDLTDVKFISASRVIAVGNQKIIRSFDGGSTWVSQTHADKYFYSLDYSTTENKVTAAYRLSPELYSYVYISTDMGLLWDSIETGIGNVKCHDYLNGDTLFLGYDYGFYLGLTDSVYMYKFIDYEFEGVSDVLFKNGVGLAVTQQFDESKIYKFNYSSPWEVEQVVNFSVPDTICVGSEEIYTPTNPTLESYEWIVDGVSVGFETDFSYVHPTAGDVSIELVTLFESNYDTVEHIVNVQEAPEVIPITFEGELVVCEGNDYYFSLLNIADGTGFSVFIDEAELEYVSETEDDRSYIIESLTETTEIEVTKWEINACDSVGITESFIIETESYPDPETIFFGLDSLVCYGDSSQIAIPIPESDVLYVLFENGDSLDSELSDGSPINMHTNPVTSFSYYNLVAYSPLGCYSEMIASDTITVEEVDANFNVGLGFFHKDSLIQIDTALLTGSYYNWYATGSPSVFENSDLIKPDIIYDETGIDTISLMIESENVGCKDSLSKSVSIFNHPVDTVDKSFCFVEDINRIEVLDQTVDKFGNVVLVGYKRVVGYWGTNIAGGVIQKYDPEGNLLWEWVHERDVPAHTDHVSVFYNGVTTDQFGNIYFVGSVNIKRFIYRDEVLYAEPSMWDRRKTFVMKINPDGDFIWINYANANVNDDGFSDVLYDTKTNNLFVAGPFLGGPGALLNSTIHGSELVEQGDLHILQFDPTGLLTNNYIVDSSPHTFNGGEFYPRGMEDGIVRKCYVRPEMELSQDSLIYLFGPTDSYAFFEDSDTVFTDHPGTNYIAILNPYGPEAGWVSAQSIPDAGNQDARIRGALDSDNNVYLSMQYEDTLDGDWVGNEYSKILKFDEDLNLIWERKFQHLAISDIQLKNDQDIFFIGNSNHYYSTYIEESPTALTVFDDTTFTQGVIGLISTEGDILWEDYIGLENNEEMFRLVGNQCGETYITGKSTVPWYYWQYSSYYYAPGTSLEVELNNMTFADSINGTYLVKISDSLCLSEGCGVLCEEPDMLPSPLISVEGDTLSTYDGYVTYQWYRNGELIPGATGEEYIFLEPGDYIVIVSDLNGCYGESAVYSVDCDAGFTPSPTVSVVDGILTTEEYDSYQWYKGGVEIPGATEQTFIFTESGIYTVLVSKDDCSGMSEPYNLEGVGFETDAPVIDLFVYPTPTEKRVINISFEIIRHSDVVLEIIDLSGQLLYANDLEELNSDRYNYTVDLEGLSAGVYICKIKVDGYSFSFKVVFQ